MHLVRFETRQDLNVALAQALQGVLSAPSDRPKAVMLAGGETPLAAYALLAQRCPAVDSESHVIFSDERMVSFYSGESNRGNIGRALEGLQLPAERFLGVDTKLPLQEAAELYDQELRSFLERGGRMELGLLGLGTDGHTASLFTLEDAAIEDERLAIGISRAQGPDRVSVTRSLLKRFDRILFLAAGKDKTAAVARFLENPLEFPAGRAVAGLASVEMWVQ